MPSRAVAALHALTSTTESPYRTMTAPSACLASRPVSRERVCWPTVTSRVVMKTLSRLKAYVTGIDFRLRLRANTNADLLADVEPLDQIRVPLCVLGLQVVEQAATASDQHQQAAP